MSFLHAAPLTCTENSVQAAAVKYEEKQTELFLTEEK